MSTQQPGEYESPLGSRRARQIATIGADMAKGSLMGEELLELALEGLTAWAAGYSEDLGYGVHRRFRVTEADDDQIDLEVTLSPSVGGYREPVACYRLTLRVDGLPS